MSYNSFNDLESLYENNQDITKPYFPIHNKSDKEKHRWLLKTFKTLLQNSKERISDINENYKFHTGKVFEENKGSGSRPDSPINIRTRAKDSRLYVNFIKLLVEEQVNKLLELKPNVDILPVHNEHEDKVGAKAGKAVLDTLWYDQDFDGVMRQLSLRAKIAGEAYLGVFWDEDKGELSPAYLEEMQANGKIQKLDDDGQPEMDEEGNPVYIEQEVRIGEIIYKHLDARRVLEEPAESFDLVNYIITYEEEYIEELKLKYPEMADKIVAANPDSIDIEGMPYEKLERLKKMDKTLVIKMYHKRHKFVPQGAELCATFDCLLNASDSKYTHDRLPIIKRTDKDTPGEQHSKSFIEDIKGIQMQHFNMTSSIVANNRLFGYPKWLVPYGSVNTDSLANVRNIVQYKGKVAPEVAKVSPTPPETFKFIEQLEEKLRLIGTGSMNPPGSPPPGVTAGVALQFLNEQDNKRYNTDIAKHFQAIKEIAILTLAVAGQYYKSSDGRLSRIVGKNNEHTMSEFENLNLNRPYDIRVAQSTGLPDTKAARVQTIIDLSSSFEGLFTREQILDSLELGDSGKMFDQATVAVKAAESIVEDLLQGKKVSPPQPYENFIVHWKIMITRMQQRDFKETVPAATKAAMEDYLLALEMLMSEKATKSPKFAEEVMQLSLYPALFELPPPIPIDPMLMTGEEGEPGAEPLTDPSEIDGSGAADPGPELMANERASVT